MVSRFGGGGATGVGRSLPGGVRIGRHSDLASLAEQIAEDEEHVGGSLG